jgi:hypothetical protein
VLHRHEFGDVGGGEGPGIDDLAAMRVDDDDRLALGDPRGLAAARRNGDQVGRAYGGISPASRRASRRV